MFKQYKLRNYKFILVMYVMILNVIGILLIGSAKPSVQSKQILGMIAGAYDHGDALPDRL